MITHICCYLTVEYIILVAFVVVGAVTLLICLAVTKAQRQREQRAQMYAAARRFVAGVREDRALPRVAASLLLKPGESAFYFAPSGLYETRAVRHYQAAHTGLRLAKGLSIGRTSGRSTSTQEWSKIDTGSLTVTNKRLVFDGSGADRTVPLGKILSVQASLQAVEVSVEDRQKSMVFEAPNPLILAAIIRICCQTDDPSDLSQTDLNIAFVDGPTD